ncbi:major facilitator superfamily domain-containing protein 9-like isoform X2 [Mercenaria mercenaria]|uniref:major facilitator superfamily domain-containing protein 9-like isoform X2 n=1 Tax=Mercenaria mercenaria TaxID=6596 RepID=UPI00234F837C|nr:major facilitator superfamily domain-containing protein 9-like isoform X2 [Mercenaria mercenaria]
MAAPTDKISANKMFSKRRLFNDPAFPIYISGFLDLFGVSMILPLIATHARDLGASPTVVGVLGSTYGAIQLFTSPLVGQWSDVAGRRFTILVCLVMSACGYMMFAFATTVVLMFVARLPLGIFKHSQNIGKSYLADITTKNDQTAKIGHFNAASSIGFVLGPPVGGHIAELKGGFYLVSLLTGAVFLLNFVLIWLTVPETTSRKEKMRRNYSSADSLRQMQSDELNFSSKGFMQAVTEIDWHDLWDLYLIKFLLGASVIVFRSNFSLMLQEKYHTTPAENGYIISVNGIVSAFVGFLTGYIADYYNNNAKLLLHLSILQVFVLLCLSLTTPLWIFVISLLPLGFVTTISRVSGTSLTFERGSKEEVGILMGFQQTCMSVARMLGPVVAGIAQEATSSGPGIVGAVLALTAVLIMIIRPQDPMKRSFKVKKHI